MNKEKLKELRIKAETRLEMMKYPFAEFRDTDKNLLDVINAVLEEEV